MKVIVLDIEAEGTGIGIGLRAQDAGHEVRYWVPTKSGNPVPYGKGLLERPTEWKPSMDWAELILVTGNNKYASDLDEYFGKGYPIFGTNRKSALLELDRGLGQEVLKSHGVKTIPYTVVDSVADGIAHIRKTRKGYAMKPWGGDADSAMTCVAKTPDDAIFTLTKWGKGGLFKGQLMLQELCDGVEMGIAAFFGPGGWSAALEESFEHKKFLVGDLGENTGEMGTVIRHVQASKLFDMVLEPVGDYLHTCNYVGDCSVNCIITDDGRVGPLEFTMRLGWPDFNIRQEVLRGDPVEWMLDLVEGRDTMKVSDKIAVGVLMAHGDFPKGGSQIGTWAGYPIKGITPENSKHLCLQQVQMGRHEQLKGTERGLETAGPYVMVVSGSGSTVAAAARNAYRTVFDIKWPSNVMYRTDIGDRLKKDLPRVQRHGFAKGMRYD